MQHVGVYWIHIAQDRDVWLVDLDKVIKFLVP